MFYQCVEFHAARALAGRPDFPHVKDHCKPTNPGTMAGRDYPDIAGEGRTEKQEQERDGWLCGLGVDWVQEKGRFCSNGRF